MTKDEAIKKLSALIAASKTNVEHLTNAGATAWSRHESALFVDQLEALGVIQFSSSTDPKDWNHLQALAKAMSDTFDGGQVTAARVNAALESYGFKIVRA